MSVDALLSRLVGVRRTGHGRWVARCPAHEDRAPSLSIRELDDGRVLLHCFAGCGVEQVLDAVGLEMDALFPQRVAGDRRPGERRPWSVSQGFAVLEHESTLLTLAALDAANGKTLTEEDRERVLLAKERVDHVIGALRDGA